VTIEPHASGRVFATDAGGVEDAWGEVVTWDPPRRVSYTFTLAQDEAHPSKIDVELVATDDGCSLRFEHGGWNDENAAFRGKLSDWRLILDRFASLAHTRTADVDAT
jgi:uncharacterized protein YndB with AHSA1/START domain